MSEKPYTDDDLRAEAASCRQALSSPPTPDDIRRSLPDTYIDSHRTESSGREATWAVAVGDDGLDAAVGEIHALIEGAADVSEWAVNLGADGLEPVGLNLNINDSVGEHRVRLHFAFAPDMDKAKRREVMDLVADAIRRT
ncbi:hypothetical protein OG209_05485 [Streptomyces sp. NBC_01383]|uniref:hypothetical protein n=1 Tax=Streptomyces sp. NBC_01383 TaxID=2903846 RepID=UPI003255A293